ncbi:MAG TPA: BrnT family toxin [Rhizobiaceae bacterium]|nr:BrnT family toxin [Rhizobiaceae bacterium]
MGQCESAVQPGKAWRSLRRHRTFEFESSETVEDNRQDYGEDRYVSLGLIGRRLHALVFTLRNLDLKTATLRVISLRKANNEEIDQYEQAKSQPDDDARH